MSGKDSFLWEAIDETGEVLDFYVTKTEDEAAAIRLFLEGFTRRMSDETNHFRYFNSSPEVIRFVVMMNVRYPLSLRNVEDPLFQHGIDICHETVRFR